MREWKNNSSLYITVLSHQRVILKMTVGIRKTIEYLYELLLKARTH